MVRSREAIEKELAVACINLDRTLKQQEDMLKSGSALPLDLALRVEELERQIRELETDLAASPAPPTDVPRRDETIEEESKEPDFLRSQLKEARDNLRLIEERKAQYVLQVEVPLQLIKEERHWRERIAELERELEM